MPSSRLDDNDVDEGEEEKDEKQKDENGGDDKEVPETVEGDPDSPEAPKSRKRNRSECNDEVALDRESKRALDHIRRIPKLSQYRADKRGRRSSVFVNEDDHANALSSHLGEMDRGAGVSIAPA